KRQVHIRCRRSVIYNHFITAVGRERLTSQPPLLFRCKKHSRSIPQHAIFGPRPIEHFLQMLQRIGSVEPRVEHAVWEHEVRSRCATQCPPNAQTAVLPDAVHNHGVILSPVLSNPGSKPRSIAVAASSGAECMN